MRLSCKSQDTAAPGSAPDNPPVTIARYVSISVAMLMLQMPREKVIAHALGFFYERGRAGKLMRRNCSKWLTRKESGAGLRIAIGADGWPIEIRD